MSATERAAVPPAVHGIGAGPTEDRGGVSSERALSARPTAIAGRLSGWLLVLTCLVLWEASARFGAIESTSWPPFTSVVSAAVAGLASGELPRIVLSTLGRMVALSWH